MWSHTCPIMLMTYTCPTRYVSKLNVRSCWWHIHASYFHIFLIEIKCPQNGLTKQNRHPTEWRNNTTTSKTIWTTCSLLTNAVAILQSLRVKSTSSNSLSSTPGSLSLVEDSPILERRSCVLGRAASSSSSTTADALFPGPSCNPTGTRINPKAFLWFLSLASSRSSLCAFWCPPSPW